MAVTHGLPNLQSATTIRQNATRVTFEDFQDVEEWLAPLDCIAFWDAVAPYNLGLQDRDHCDGLISSGKVKPEIVLDVLKFLAVMELRVAFDLKCRVTEPVTAQYLVSRSLKQPSTFLSAAHSCFRKKIQSTGNGIFFCNAAAARTKNARVTRSLDPQTQCSFLTNFMH